MTQPGWYPDPGQQGNYRYWDGHTWSEDISLTPSMPPESPQQSTSDPSVKTKRNIGVWVTLIVGALVLALTVWFIVAHQADGKPEPDPPPTSTYIPTPKPTTQMCPPRRDIERADHPVDDRVYGGDLSYPMMDPPWRVVDHYDTRIPYSTDVAHQFLSIHVNPDTEGEWHNWANSMFVARLSAGEGFYEPEEGSRIVNKCILGAFFANTLVTSETMESKSYSVDRYDGWYTETKVSYSLKNLPSTSSIIITIIVKTSERASSIFMAIVANDSMESMSDVEAAIADLRVGI